MTAALAKSAYDFVIIGGGAAGFAAATKAEELGVKTALVNGGLPMGGTCVNVGCVPSKHLLEVSHKFFYPPRSPFPAVQNPKGTVDFPLAIAHKDALVSALRKRNYADVLDSWTHVDYVEGRAAFTGPKTIRVDGHAIQGERFLIATVRPPVHRRSRDWTGSRTWAIGARWTSANRPHR